MQLASCFMFKTMIKSNLAKTYLTEEWFYWIGKVRSSEQIPERESSNLGNIRNMKKKKTRCKIENKKQTKSGNFNN